MTIVLSYNVYKFNICNNFYRVGPYNWNSILNFDYNS